VLGPYKSYGPNKRITEMLIRHREFEPNIDSSAYIAPNTVVSGKVEVGPRSRIMYGAALDSEGSRIEIGECTIICENAVLRATACGDVDHPVLVGNHVFVSPHTTLLGCTVESYSYVATGATVVQGALVHSGAIVAVGAFVHANTVVPANFFVPPNCIAIGDPIRIFSADEKEALVDAIKPLGFTNVAFGVNPNENDRVKKATEVRSKEFESHFDDVVLSLK
jgi:carbonic anhydrase/acetyltransferase-like protein (isoleucine patch superfamily)